MAISAKWGGAGAFDQASPLQQTQQPLTELIYFPGGHVPSFEQMTRAAGRQRLKILDMEILRGHYAKTLEQWRQAFRQNIATVRQNYDERFIRM